MSASGIAAAWPCVVNSLWPSTVKPLSNSPVIFPLDASYLMLVDLVVGDVLQERAVVEASPDRAWRPGVVRQNKKIATTRPMITHGIQRGRDGGFVRAVTRPRRTVRAVPVVATDLRAGSLFVFAPAGLSGACYGAWSGAPVPGVTVAVTRGVPIRSIGRDCSLSSLTWWIVATPDPTDPGSPDSQPFPRCAGVSATSFGSTSRAWSCRRSARLDRRRDRRRFDGPRRRAHDRTGHAGSVRRLVRRAACSSAARRGAGRCQPTSA